MSLFYKYRKKNKKIESLGQIPQQVYGDRQEEKAGLQTLLLQEWEQPLLAGSYIAEHYYHSFIQENVSTILTSPPSLSIHTK